MRVKNDYHVSDLISEDIRLVELYYDSTAILNILNQVVFYIEYERTNIGE